MSSTPFISIVTGYYNRKNHIDETITSLLNQDYPNYEIVIFDDASTDGSSEIFKDLELKHDKIRLIQHQKNLGFTEGLINAINTCSSDYIAIHGSGDFSHPKRLSRQAKILNLYDDVGVVGCGLSNIEIDDQAQVIEEKKLHLKEFHKSFKTDIIATNPFTHGEVMFRKTFYDQAGGYRKQFRFAQDRDLWCRMSRICNFYNVPENLYTRYILPDGVGAKVNKLLIQRMLSEFARQCHEEVLAGREDYIDKYGDQGLFFFKFNKRISENLYYLCYKLYRLGKYEDGDYVSYFFYQNAKNYYAVKSYYRFYKYGKRLRDIRKK